MSEAIEAVLRGAGLTDKPDEFDSDIHSWRCGHPKTYGPCDCFQELVSELAEVRREAAAEAYEKGRLDERHDCRLVDAYEKAETKDPEALRRSLRSANPYRAEAYRREGGE